MIFIRHKGDFKKTEKLLKKSLGANYESILKACGEWGVQELSMATPIDTGETASSWYYELVQKDSYLSVVWYNSNVNKGINIALILQYGHATRNGGWVEGLDYINPALRPVFEQMAMKAWKEVIS